MPYVKVYTRANGEWAAHRVDELTRREVKYMWQHGLSHRYRVISGAEAHQWVREGGLHTTPLFIDADKRIRYARDAS